MTDTKQISDAIKGLPDEGHFIKFAKAGVWVDVPTPLKNSDLKALVAENDSRHSNSPARSKQNDTSTTN